MMGRLLKAEKTCPECSAPFRPSHAQQVCCSRSCGAVRRCRLHPRTANMRQAWAATQARARHARYAKLRGMTPTQIWHAGYQAGYGAGYQRGRRTGAARRVA